MLAAVSHDLQTSITRMRLRVELAMSKADRTPIIADLEFMSAVVKEALAYGQSMNLVVDRKRINIGVLMRVIGEELRDLGHDIDIVGEVSCPVLGSPSQLRRAIGNVVENAVKFGSWCEVELVQANAAVVIYVRDDGPGVPEDMIDAIRQPFVRVEGSRNRVTGGSGLGLAITDNIVKANGGTMIIRNLPRGLEISLCLPCDPPDATAPSRNNVDALVAT